MDVWVVAAAAGAGYVAQRLKNLTCKQVLSDLSCENHNFVGPSTPGSIQVEGKSSPFHRILSRKSFRGEMLRKRDEAFEDASATEMASTSSSTVSNLNTFESFLTEEDNQRDPEGRVPPEIDKTVPPFSSREMGFPYGFRKNRSNLRSRRINSQFVKPLTSLESCVMAQFYKELDESGDYNTCSDHQSHKQTLRPFLVSDGTRIISKSPHESFSVPTGRENTSLQNKKTVFGVPRLPNILPLELQKKHKAKIGKLQLSRSEDSKIVNQAHNNARGSSDGALIFYFGLTMGVLSSCLASKQEIEKLNKLLKQTENLVQDLHEELEMKDSITVKELVAEDYESCDVNNAPYLDDPLLTLSRQQKLDNSFNEECSDQKPEEESMRKIEEELEAELERLETNMNSRLEGKLSNITEISPDFVSNVTMGELRADLFGAKTDSETDADKDGTGISTPHSVQYPVSPRELSLRLHEVIQSRLEERVKELETVLQKSQRKIAEYKHMGPTESLDQPVVINLSGEALMAYNEAYGELTKLSDSDDENFGFGFETSEHFENFNQREEIVDRVGNGGVNGYVDGYLLSNGSTEMGSSSHNGDDEDEDEDEMERLLIRQIVEKAKQGSPAILKAQRSLLLLNDENEH